MSAELTIDDNFESFANLIEDGLWLGSEDAGQVELELLQARGITHVLVPAYTGLQDVIKYPEHLSYYQRYVADISDYPFLPLWPGFIERIELAKAQGGAVLVHCAAGKSRSAALVIAYLMKSRQWDFATALSHVRARRPQVATKFEEQLRLWHRIQYSADHPLAPRPPKFN